MQLQLERTTPSCFWDVSDGYFAGRKRPATQLQPERYHSEALRGGHREVLRGDRWKLLRVQSLSALPSDADLLASLKGGEAFQGTRQSPSSPHGNLSHAIYHCHKQCTEFVAWV